MAEIELQRDGSVAYIVLNRPRQRNALTQAMWSAIPGLIDTVEHDSSVKIVILRGAEPSAFAAGADIAEFPQIYATPERAIAANDTVQIAQRRLWDLAKPSIAMIQGVCVGGGCGLALACDFRFADPTSRSASPLHVLDWPIVLRTRVGSFPQLAWPRPVTSSIQRVCLMPMRHWRSG